MRIYFYNADPFIFSIHFPDPNDPNTRKSTVTITGTIESAVTAKVFLLVSTINLFLKQHKHKIGVDQFLNASFRYDIHRPFYWVFMCLLGYNIILDYS